MARGGTKGRGKHKRRSARSGDIERKIENLPPEKRKQVMRSIQHGERYAKRFGGENPVLQAIRQGGRRVVVGGGVKGAIAYREASERHGKRSEMTRLIAEAISRSGERGGHREGRKVAQRVLMSMRRGSELGVLHAIAEVPGMEKRVREHLEKRVGPRLFKSK